MSCFNPLMNLGQRLMGIGAKIVSYLLAFGP